MNTRIGRSGASILLAGGLLVLLAPQAAAQTGVIEACVEEKSRLLYLKNGECGKKSKEIIWAAHNHPHENHITTLDDDHIQYVLANGTRPMTLSQA